MNDLLEEAMDRLRELPEPVQDSVARALLLQLDEEQTARIEEYEQR